jgi:hypothetical protein
MMEHRGRQAIVKPGDLFLAQFGYLSAAPARASIVPTLPSATMLSKSSKWASKSWAVCTMTNVRRRAMMQIEPIGRVGR